MTLMTMSFNAIRTFLLEGPVKRRGHLKGDEGQCMRLWWKWSTPLSNFLVINVETSSSEQFCFVLFVSNSFGTHEVDLYMTWGFNP